jgi:hypothetical protein
VGLGGFRVQTPFDGDRFEKTSESDFTMATHEHELSTPPKGERARELWLQHAAGFIVFQDSRAYAIERIDARLNAKARAAVIKGIDDALYGLMMIADGVTGCLANDSDEVSLSLVVRHSRKSSSGDFTPVSELELAYGDGMCAGVHGWHKGDFGDDPPAVSRARKAKPGTASKAKAGKARTAAKKRNQQ